MTEGDKQEAWAGFVYELRRNGYWNDPEKFREYFEGYFDSYFRGEESLVHALQHCCDPLDDEEGLLIERDWLHWTSEDKANAKKEFRKLMNKNE